MDALTRQQLIGRREAQVTRLEIKQYTGGRSKKARAYRKAIRTRLTAARRSLVMLRRVQAAVVAADPTALAPTAQPAPSSKPLTHFRIHDPIVYRSRSDGRTPVVLGICRRYVKQAASYQLRESTEVTCPECAAVALLWLRRAKRKPLTIRRLHGFYKLLQEPLPTSSGSKAELEVDLTGVELALNNLTRVGKREIG